jgi:hypothetical protein
MRLVRITGPSFPLGQWGRLSLPGFSCVTVERPWLNNEPFISCIPAGVYPIRWAKFWRGGYETIEICEVPHRTEIKVHKAIWPEHVEGCVGVGTRIAVHEGRLGILGQSEALEGFLEAAKRASPELIEIVYEGWQEGA